MNRLREMRPDDHAAVAALLRRNGLAATSHGDWLRLWQTNPFREPGAVMGWVLEDPGGSVVGTFGNLPLRYEWNRRPLRVAAAYAWAVDAGFRGDSLRLFRRYLRQPHVDLLLTSTASSRVGEIFSAARFRPVPHAAYDEALLWITDAKGFAASTLRHLGLPLADALSAPAGLALRALTWRPRSRRPELLPKATRVFEFDARFDDLWERLRGTADRLQAVRSAAVLSWHFGPALERGELAVLVLEEHKALSGYVVMFRHDHPAIGLTRYRVADLQVLGDAASRVQTLMTCALRLAAEQGVHALEVVGLAQPKRDALVALSPRRRKLPSWLFYYRARDPVLAAALEARSAWDPSPFDGDASL